jgi:hypothetical protein
MARFFGVSHTTIGTHLSRAGRLALLQHQALLQGADPKARLLEPLVVDGFETFEYSQFFPFHINLAAGSESWFLYGFTDSPLRRKGCMTATQRERREELEDELGRPDPKSVENGIYRLLRPLLPMFPRESEDDVLFFLHTDDHPAYPRALRRLRRLPGAPRLEHRVTSSKEARTTGNPLFPVNLADLLLRHCQAAHRRETIAFCKRRQGALERAAVFLFWRNYVKWQRERKPGTTAAMRAGILSRRLSWKEAVVRRQFPVRGLLPRPWWSYYWRRVQTPIFGSHQTGHDREYAF